MEQLEAAALTKLKMLEHKLDNWSFDFQTRKSNCGTCYHNEKVIKLSLWYVSSNSIENVLKTILHEIAHALVGPSRKPHGQLWKVKCASIGGIPRRVNTDAIVPDSFKHHYKCPKCGYVFKTHRKLSNYKVRFHKECGRGNWLVKIK